MKLEAIGSAFLLATSLTAGCFDPGDSNLTETESGTQGTGSTGGSTGITTSSGTTGTETTSSTTSQTEGSTTGGGACSGPDGQVDEACEAPTPLCWQGECISCDALTEGGCSAVDAQTPVCDGASGTCVPCHEHDQCETAACVMSTGACVPETHRLFVDRTADCDAGDGTADAPLCTIAPALEAVSSQPGEDPWAIFVAGAALPYDETITWSSPHPLAIIGPSSGIAAEIDGGTGNAVTAIGGGQLSVAHLVIQTGIGGQGLTCIYAGAPTSLWADDMTVTGGAMTFMVDCDATFRRSVFGGSTDVRPVSGSLVFEDGAIEGGGGLLVEGTMMARRTTIVGMVDVTGGTLGLENTFVQFEAPVQVPASINAVSGGSVDLLYSTVETGFTCDGGGPTSIRNSIVLGQTCPSTQIDQSAVDQGMDQGEGNAQLTMDVLGDVFVPGSLHIEPDAPVVRGLAVWRNGDPETDADGDPRPVMDGAADDAGADVPLE